MQIFKFTFTNFSTLCRIRFSKKMKRICNTDIPNMCRYQSTISNLINYPDIRDVQYFRGTSVFQFMCHKGTLLIFRQFGYDELEFQEILFTGRISRKYSTWSENKLRLLCTPRPTVDQNVYWTGINLNSIHEIIHLKQFISKLTQRISPLPWTLLYPTGPECLLDRH